MDLRPVVGVVGHGHVLPRPFGPLPVTGTPTAYVEGLRAVGARPVVLPGSCAVELLDTVDGVVLTGGDDVDPALSGADPAVTGVSARARDDDEIALVRMAAKAGVPLLGVCRGLQVLAVAFGGTLVGGQDHVRPDLGHEVSTAPGSVLHGVVGPRVRTSALHQQAVADLGSSWRPTAWADDGVVEAIEWADGGWSVLGVQWHPELAWSAEIDDPTGPALFGWLAAAARARSVTRQGGGPRTLVRS